MYNINLFFNKLKFNSGAIWLENETIKIFVTEKLKNQETKDFILNNKSQLISVLKENNIFSKENFSNVFIFRNKETINYPLSPAQERLWFVEQYEEGSNAYHLPNVLELDVDTDKEGIKYALQQIVSRHEILRSTIEQRENQENGTQKVHSAPLFIEEITLTDTIDYKSLIKEDINRPFNLNAEYPIRIKFYTIESSSSDALNKTLLLINMHHIASDGWSMGLFQKELYQFYEGYINSDENFSLPELEIQYKDYALWQKSYLVGEILDNQLNYWKNKLSGFQLLEFPIDYARPSEINYKGASQRFKINNEVGKKLRQLGQQYGVSLNSVMLSSINILLNKYTGQDDIVIGTAIANRHHKQTEELIGFFVNAQANRTILNNTQTFEQLIQLVHQDQIDAQLHQDLPFEKLVDELGIERDSSRHPIYQIKFIMESFGSQNESSKLQKDYFKPYLEEEVYEVAKFDLLVTISDNQEELIGEISYATSLFHKDTIARLVNHYMHLLEQLTQTPTEAYSQISLLNSEEYEQIVYKLNAVDKEYSFESTIHELFQDQVVKIPNNIALVYEGEQLTYNELNEKSNQLARHIRTQYEKRVKQPLPAETLIAICLDRSLEMVVGILAILKAGGAYVPIDPSYPQERIDYILEDTGAELILTQKHLKENNHIQFPQNKVVCIDLTEECYTIEDNSNLPSYNKSKNLAYVIYTSGTTGKPKGVMVEHDSVIYYLLSFKKLIQKEHINMFSVLNYCFDAALPTLLSGAIGNVTTHISTKDIFLNQGIEHYIQENKIDTMRLTPSMLESLNLSDINQELNIVMGGEMISYKCVNDVISNKNITLFNQYGPTESTVGTTVYKIDNKIEQQVIGKPYAGKRIFVLDKNNKPLPVGVVGELYIGGAALSRGYLNRPELTAERFINNPFATESDKIKGYDRLYKTGDLVRWLSNGNLEYIGRNDDQIKLNGYRIELGEIEHALKQIEGIKQSCVLIKNRETETGSAKYLVGYYVFEDNNVTVSQTVILEKLSHILPEYMIPSALVAMELFPLTINGKLDKRALPDPDFTSSEDLYAAPKNEIEAQLCEIWQLAFGIERVGVTDDFFKIGGNSILAIKVSHRMSKFLGYSVKVADVFKHKTIAQILIHTADQMQINIPKINSNQAPLSFAQERLWFIEQYEEGTNAYHMPVVLELDADTDKEGLKYALQQIVLRHEVLRSTIKQEENQEFSTQTVHDDPLSIEEVYLKDTEDYDLVIEKDINKPFNFAVEYPIRAKFYVIESSSNNSSSKILLLINRHHIASDGWSIGIFQKELLAFYEAYVNKDLTFSIPALEIQYKDYSQWQRSYLVGNVLEKQLNHWKNKLSGYQTLEFPTDYPRPIKTDYRGADQWFKIDKEISQKLHALTQRCGVTLNSVLLSGINILLNKYTGQEDITIGSPIANRHHKQTEELIGFFVNTQVSRAQLNSTQSFEELILATHKDQIEAQLHQDISFEKLVAELGIERDASRHPIFQIMFSVRSFDDHEKKSGLQKNYFKPYQINDAYQNARFDLSITIDDSGEELLGLINYATSLFHEDSITKFNQRYLHLLEQLIENPSKPYSEISLLSSDEYNQVVYDWNATSKAYSKNKSVIDIFEEQVINTPNNIAIVFGDKELTYKQLDEESSKLAGYLIENYKVQENDFIGIMLDRSEKMIIAILGIMKAGAAYVCIDSEYPIARKEYIIQDTSLNILITQTDYIFDLDFYSGNLFAIDVQLDSIEASMQSIKKNTNPSDLAYIIYTSGTTGQPKGVMVEHCQIVSFALDNNFINYEKANVIAGVSNYSFDGSVFDLFFSLLNGKKLVIIDKDTLLDLSKLDDHFIKFKIDTVFITTALFNSLVQNKSKCFESLQQVLFGGERCNLEIVNKFKSQYKTSSLIHVYGPTENIVYSTYCELNDCNTDKIVPIGKQLSDKKLYVLSSNNMPVPIGIVGELYIGGAGLSRGYLNRPELTAERFVANPFATDSDKENGYTQLYKTGDLVRWLPDGNIEYIGRNDDQVKIRGYRIELGEIEYAMSQIEGIKQVCVFAKKRKSEIDGSEYLAAYYVVDSGEEIINQTVILEKLALVLPDYMIPAALVAIESFPLNSSGKINKNALPNPEFTSLSNDYIEPKTQVEKEISEIWQEVLGLEKVSIIDDFFRIGGDSILSIQITNRIKQAGFSCQVKDIFEYKTIVKLAEYLSTKKSEIDIIAEQGLLTGELNFLPVQQWFVDKVENGELAKSNHWNQSFLIRVPELEAKKIEEIVEQLVSYHDVLRIRYSKEQDSKTGKIRWKQMYQSNIPLHEIKTLDVSQHSENEVHEILTNWQSGFDLEQGVLFQIGYLHGYTDNSARIYFALHHMIVDGVSWRILAEDVKDLFQGKALPSKSSSYRQWITSVENYSAQHPSEGAYWEEQLRDMPNYQLDCEIKEISSKTIELDTVLTKSFLQEASKAYHTEVNDLLLTALAYALKEINNHNVQGITLEGHGRVDIDPTIDHSRTVGWFTTMFPVRLEIQNNYKESIPFIKESLRNIPNKGIGFGAFAVTEVANYSQKDLIPVGFNYLGQFETQHKDWQFASESSGCSMHPDNIGHNLININGIVSDSKMHFDVVTKLGEETTALLSESFKTNLTKIINHCIDKLEEEGATHTPTDFPEFIPYEIFNEHLEEDPIFIFPPGGSGAESYYNSLVPRLNNRKLVLFNNFFAFMKTQADNYASTVKMEDLADFYRIWIQKLQTKGKYTFVGWSFGGVLAFEIFNKLLGNRVEKSDLILLDSYFDFRSIENYLPQSCIEEFKKIIHYRYNPRYNAQNLNIVLFKASKMNMSEEENNSEILPTIFRNSQKFYVESMYNGLDKVLESDDCLVTEKIQLIDLDCHHDNILETSSDVICDFILTRSNKVDIKISELENLEKI
jgi:amino acid adenylation domain-containing protein/non-ribosomal peptide synthase protein (TIGR01720 family)